MNDENPFQSPQTRADETFDESGDGVSPENSANVRFANLTSFLTLADAQVCQAILRQEGIESFLENEASVTANWLWSNAVGGVKLLVPYEHLEAASKLLDVVKSASQPSEPLGDITFECEECGKQITFPGKRRGKTETCPKCHEYVDVPE